MCTELLLLCRVDADVEKKEFEPTFRRDLTKNVKRLVREYLDYFFIINNAIFCFRRPLKRIQQDGRAIPNVKKKNNVFKVNYYYFLRLYILVHHRFLLYKICTNGLS